MNPSQAEVAAMLAAAGVDLDGGTAVFYNVASFPASPETALSSPVTLATYTFTGSALNGATFAGGTETATANFTATSENPVAGGVCNLVRLFNSAGTALDDCTTGISGSGADVIMGNTTVQTGVPIQFTLSLKMPAV